MSLLMKRDCCILIDHKDYITKLYESVSSWEKEIIPYTISPKLFSIVHDKNDVNRKRTHDSDDFHEETVKVKELYEKFIQEISDGIKTKICEKYKILGSSAVRGLSKQLFESTVFNHVGMNGGNYSHVSLKSKIKDDYFLIPAKSRFFCGCIKEQCEKLDGNFDIVIADPPWWNKYIRRLKSANDKLSYSMMYNDDIASIPVKNLVASNCLVAVWCTNSPSNICAVKDLIFPTWGVEYAATWYWLKVTADLEPICPFGSGCRKQPYERLMLGKVGHIKDIPDGQLIVSVPSALHSHKPPLLDLLTPYVDKENPQTLELFARYLLPNTTSVGYEPLKWQHISLYENVT